MCDQDAFDDMTEYHLKSGVSRREVRRPHAGREPDSRCFPRGRHAEVTETGSADQDTRTAPAMPISYIRPRARTRAY